MYKSSARQRQPTETSILKLSLGVSCITAGIGVVFGLISESNAIILDGIASAISLISTWLSVIASRLVLKPENERFQFGYRHIEPLVNFVRSLIVVAVSLYAVLTAVVQIRQGGRSITDGWVLAYALVTLMVSALIYTYQMRYVARTGSTSIRLEAQEWWIDCLSSLGILAGYGVALWLEQRGFMRIAALIDPILVFSIVAITLPFPVKTLHQNLLDILLIAPDEEIQQKIRSTVAKVGSQYGFERFRLHTSQYGNSLDVEVNIIVDDSFVIPGVSYLDRIRQDIWEGLNMPSYRLWLVVCFVGDERWA
ncbi:cation diffusion facilitator family transporter [Chroococcidiopsis sp. TS-821]|uniref:cation diffusion facilitator family transporter n=1 Tax=Chroococcidiopsis sp. TS-821 TaxID=1378066 RepID=UPI000CEDE1CA|nr:cation diffusion facilitator family transporter [Chroococcidiopsis sp. TS-821]PPS45590.1 hypothetical protein B1A85_04925 [Chroococcidiopsis sp. TS-821]